MAASMLTRLALLLAFSSFTSVVRSVDPSDEYRDADLGQSSYLGGNHNMDPAVVGSSSFGILWTQAFNSKEQFYAKPLTYTPSGSTQQLVFLASSQNWIRTLDAKTGAIINQRQVQTPFLQSDVGCTDIPNYIGITGTPTIDINTDIVYFYAKTYIPNRLVPGNTGVQNGVYYFYAVSITTLQDVPGFPILVDGSQYDNDPRRYFIGGTTLQRPSLLQLGNTIYGSFGGICDLYNYTGSTIGIDVAQKKIVSVWGSQVGPQSAFSTDYTGDGGGGGIWQSGAGLATDGNRIFFVTGNGQGHENNAVPAPGSSGCKTLGESAVNLVPDPDTGKLTTFDYFQPYDYINMDGGDQDFGSGGISLLDPTVFNGTGVARMALTAGKNGKIYVLNADNLGGFKQGPGQTDLVLQTITTNKAVFGGAGSYPLEGGYIYYTPVGYPTYAYKLGHDGSGNPVFSQVGISNEVSAGRVGVGIPTVTTFKGRPGTGIVWMTDPNAGLRAWNAVPDNSGKLTTIKLPTIGGVVKFQRPSFGNGRVYTTTSDGSIYCLGSPVNLPLNCTSLDFGPVALGSSANGTVQCTTLIAVTLNGMTVGDSSFVVKNSSLPTGQLAAGKTFTIPVIWNLTNAVVNNSPNASFGSVTPGFKSTPLTIFTTNAVAGYATFLPVGLTGTQVSSQPYLDFVPNTLDFGGLVLGVGGEDPMTNAPFIISNLGLSPMTILGYAYTQDGLDDNPDYTNATADSQGVWDLGPGFTAKLPQVGTVLSASQSLPITATFKAAGGVGSYLSYFSVYTDGGSHFIILEGSASTAPVANFSISTSEGGWLPQNNLLMDLGAVNPGNNSTRQIRICNQGGSTLTISKSKPPLGLIRATLPTTDLHESQTIPVNTCAYGTVMFAPQIQQVDIPDVTVTNSWTLNTDDLNFGVHVVQMTGIIHSKQMGPIYANNASSKYLYLGCYQDQSPRLMPVNVYSGSLNENNACINACAGANYTFAATEYQRECWCGNVPPAGQYYHTDAEKLCTYTCANDTSQVCGGNGGYMSIFYDQSKFSPDNQTFNTTVIPAVTKQVVANYSFIGCYTEGTGGRALSNGISQVQGTGGSLEYCAQNCGAGKYQYFGVENFNECYCGNAIQNNATLIAGGINVTQTGCSQLCGGNRFEYCGGSSKLDMYQLTSTLANVTSSSISSSSPSSTSSVSSSTVLTNSTTSASSSTITLISNSSSTSVTVSSNASTTSSSSATITASNTTLTSSSLSTLSITTSANSSVLITSTSASANSSTSSTTLTSGIISSTSTSTSTSTASTPTSMTSSTSPSISPTSTAASTTSTSASVTSSTSTSTISSTSTSASTTNITTINASTSTTSTSSTPTATPFTCPTNNGTFYRTTNGTYLIQCNTDHSQGNIAGTGQTASTYQICIDRCVQTSGCVAFSWSTGPKACYLKSSIGKNVTNSGVWGGQLVLGPSAAQKRRVRRGVWDLDVEWA